MANIKLVFPFGSHELDYFELNIRLKQVTLLEDNGFTHVCENDIPLSSDDFPIGEYRTLIIERMNSMGGTDLLGVKTL
tara:strand:- start:6825 stop:7058 length:234 start_codon:yes stop_codon:yes gene_type:complete